MIKTLEKILNEIKFYILTLFFLAKEPKLPIFLKALSLFGVYYFLSPIDFIPDFIPFLGQLDDLLILPTIVLIIFKFSPKELISKAQNEARSTKLNLSSNSLFSFVILIVWILIVLSILHFGFKII
jgi:uncharacterized membrane protein YkvA (DUF1232 family)